MLQQPRKYAATLASAFHPRRKDRLRLSSLLTSPDRGDPSRAELSEMMIEVDGVQSAVRPRAVEPLFCRVPDPRVVQKLHGEDWSRWTDSAAEDDDMLLATPNLRPPSCLPDSGGTRGAICMAGETSRTSRTALVGGR
jgi:hypothetical protein